MFRAESLTLNGWEWAGGRGYSTTVKLLNVLVIISGGDNFCRHSHLIAAHEQLSVILFFSDLLLMCGCSSINVLDVTCQYSQAD